MKELDFEEAKRQVKSAKEMIDTYMSFALDLAKEELGEKKYKAWKDVFDRYIKAELQGNKEMAKSLKKDLDRLSGN